MIPRRLSLIGGILLAVPLPMLWADSPVENEADATDSMAAATVAPVAASVVLSNLVQIYDGTAKQPTITTQPAGLRVQLTFDGTTSTPVGAGSYRVTATVVEPGYVGTSTGTLTINRATPVITWSEPAAITYGTALTGAQLSASANVPGTITYDPSAGTVLNAGRQQLLTALFTPSDTANLNTVSAVTDITVNKAVALVTLAGLSQPYDGTPAAVAPRTIPANLKVAVEYDETTDAPVFPGEHRIAAIVDDANYVGGAFESMNITITALVRHAPRLAGMIDGSLQILSAENVVLRGNAWISGDLLVPGTPTLALHGLPMIVGTYDASGLDLPANYTVSIEDGFIIRYLVRRIDPLNLPMVAAPLAPSGTRDVTVTAASPNAGDFTTIRDLTADNIVGEIAVPAGKYGVLTAAGGGGFVLGHAGATAPDVYHVQRLVLTSGAHLRIAGPVLLMLANGITVSGVLGDVDHPEWLTLAVAAGGVTIQAEGRLYGNILAPEGEVTIERDAAIVGEVASDRLTIKQDGVLAEPRS